MAVYRLMASLTGLNTLSCIDRQVYQARDALTTEFAFQITALLVCVFAGGSQTRKEAFRVTPGRNTPLQEKHKKAGSRRLFVRGCFRSSVHAMAYATAPGFFSRLGLRLGLPSASAGLRGCRPPVFLAG